MTKVVLAVLFVASIVHAEHSSSSRVKVLTVCEVLGGLNRYTDTPVAVVGRMDHSVSLIDHYEFLSQDHCEHPIVTHGHMWPSKIQIWSGWEKGMPKPPSDRPALKQTVIAAKLSVVERSTKLGCHREPQFDAGGHPIAAAEVQNEWAVVYGRIVRSPKLNHDCGVGGCGGDDVPLIIIAELTQVRRVTVDGNIMPGRLALARLHV